MKIYDRDLTGASAAESGRAQESQKPDKGNSSRSSSAAQGSGDRVELSSTLSRVSRAMTSYQSDRAARVQALAAQVQAGSYQPDSLGTSRGMVAEALSGGR